MRWIFVVGAFLLPIGSAAAATYEIGPGRAYENIGDVPLEALQAGDLVLIHWRAAPYAEKLALGGAGTEEAPIVIHGVAGPGGELPVIDGRDATTRPQLDFWNEGRSVVKIGGSSAPADAPSYLVLEGLEIRSGRPPYTFTDAAGDVVPYADNAAAVMVENGDHITIRDCVLRDSTHPAAAAAPQHPAELRFRSS